MRPAHPVRVRAAQPRLAERVLALPGTAQSAQAAQSACAVQSAHAAHAAQSDAGRDGCGDGSDRAPDGAACAGTARTHLATGRAHGSGRVVRTTGADDSVRNACADPGALPGDLEGTRRVERARRDHRFGRGAGDGARNAHPPLAAPAGRTSVVRRAPLVAAIGLALVLAPAPARAAIPAFPGAEGFGATTTGGRGGAVVEVTTLADAGPGSLRDALQVRTGPRTVVFRVSGTIALTEPIVMREANSFVTVAGQTAPGDGVQLKNYGLMLRDGVHDVVVRYLRIRPGDTTPGDWNKDGATVYGYLSPPVRNVVFDHVSFEWAVDENVNVWDWVESVTFQWCLIAEGSMTGHPNGPHSMGLLSGAHPRINLSVHHSLFAHNAGRNPRLGDNSEGVNDFRDNVVYNWRNIGAAETYGGAPANFVANTYIAGPSSSVVERRTFAVPDRTNSTGVRLYLDGNRGPLCPEGCDDDWALGVKFVEDNLLYPADEALYRIARPLAAPPVTTWPAALAYDRVLDGAGATLPRRDAVDTRIVEQVRARTGTVGIGSDYPQLRGVAPPADLDHDGMPDAWETLHGLNALDAADRNGDANGDGYTNLEEYLNQRDPRAAVPPAGGGAVPDGVTVPGRQLTVRRAPGGRLALDWGASCRAGDTDYAIYEGALANFGSHVPHHCSTGGATSMTYRPAGGDLYLLVVPHDAVGEGSYGRDGTGVERPPSATPCLPQAARPCP